MLGAQSRVQGGGEAGGKGSWEGEGRAKGQDQAEWERCGLVGRRRRGRGAAQSQVGEGRRAGEEGWGEAGGAQSRGQMEARSRGSRTHL